MGYRFLDAPVPQMVDQAAEVVRFLVSLSCCCRAGYRSVHDHSRGTHPAASAAPGSAPGGTVGGSADDSRLCSCKLWPCKPWGGGKHELCLSSSTPPGQGGIQILAAATLAEVVDVSVTTQLRSSRFRRVRGGCLSFSSSTVWLVFQLLHRDRAHSANCAKDGDSPGAVLGLGIRPSLGNDRSRQFSLEVQFLPGCGRPCGLAGRPRAKPGGASSDSVHRLG